MNRGRCFVSPAGMVLDTSIEPGGKTPLHSHRWPATLYILSWSNFVRRDQNGAIILDSRTVSALAPGSAVWSTPLIPHTLENVGDAELHVIAVELKTAPVPTIR